MPYVHRLSSVKAPHANHQTFLITLPTGVSSVFPQRLDNACIHTLERLVWPVSVALNHLLREIVQRTIKVLATSQFVLVDEQNVLLETRVEVGLQSKLSDNCVVVAVDVGINAIHALKDLPHR